MPKAHAVTGAFGYSGKYMARLLLGEGKRVVTLTHSPARENPFDGKIEARPYCFDDADKMAEHLSDVEVLYNTYWVRFNHTNFTHQDAVQNTLVLFEAAKRAGVKKIVHVSITSADENSHLEYFQGKGFLERKLRESGLSYAILRPAVIFGPEDILISNIAWTLRYFPVFGIFGDGAYHIQPIFVEDLAKIAVEAGKSSENALIQAVGPEDFTYLELVKTMGRILGRRRPIFHLSPKLGFLASTIIGKLVNDVFVTREEIDGLMADTLHAPGSPPAGTTRLTDWITANAKTLGKTYASELARRRDRKRAYR
ncbi:NAD(P)H-binding protein [Desulfosarcina sp. OttesenSCG-928-G10]|nr:NAD(P)H-binding protein [Desulfosarcina sp. OttesenSCG-928-G10]